MAFLDGIGKKLTETGNQLKKNTDAMVNTAKLNGMIADEEKRINALFLQIGKAYFEKFSAEPDVTVADLVRQIDESKSKILNYNEQIKHIKGVIKCPNCGEETSIEKPFCSSCGSVLNVKPVEPIHSEAIPSNDNVIYCKNCGAAVSSDKAFCTGCGQKL